MPSPAFTELVGRLIEAMGQSVDRVRPVAEGLVVHTSDGFLYVFIEDPDELSLTGVQQLLGQAKGSPVRVVFLTPGRMPLALLAELARQGATLVDGARFLELAKSLGLETYLGEGPRPPATSVRARLLPSALQLDVILARARSWQDWGVPALALRFFRQATELKPEFVPARNGIGRALLGLGLTADAEHVFNEVLSSHPTDVEAKLGRAAVLGAQGRALEEIAAYRSLLEEEPARTDVRAHLVAALVDLPDWMLAQAEIEKMLSATPEDPRLRFLYSVAIEKNGDPASAEQERDRARSLGLPIETERMLCERLGLPRPPQRSETSAPSAPGTEEVTVTSPTPSEEIAGNPRAPARARSRSGHRGRTRTTSTHARKAK
ncbi:MAG: tetratricopeptide repeat protein [Thermoplasmata archaeon]